MAESQNYFRDNDDLQFQYKHGLRWEELVPLIESDFTAPDGPKSLDEAREFYDEVIASVGAYAAREIGPKAAQIDREGTHLKDGEVVFPEALQGIFDGMKEMGLYGLTLPRAHGGSNGPLALYFVVSELIARGDVACMTHYAFHGGVAASLLGYSIKEGSAKFEKGQVVSTRWDAEIRDMAEGKHFGCMVLTEPDAGSDLGKIRAKAKLVDGVWRIDGEKIFITSGHGQYNLVLARTEEGGEGGLDGLKGLSLFLVRRKLERDGKTIDNVVVTKVEEKLGHHASATVSLQYDNAEGELIGRRGQGFELMLMLMNSARIGVGFEAIGNAESAYRKARAWAAERVTMGKPIERHELVAEKLLEMETWIAALRALAFEAVNCVEISQRLEFKLQADPPSDPAARAKAEARQKTLARKARRLTPLLKYIAAERGLEMTRDAMQLHGGMGYIDETGVHKHLRDALVLPVYEGTSQIQALMATKDHLLWAARDPAGFLRRDARARLLARTAATPLEREVHRAEAVVHRSTETLMLRIFGTKLRAEWEGGLKGKDVGDLRRYLASRFLREWDAKADFAQGLLHAERLTRMLADVAIAKILVKQALRFPERKKLAERFVVRMSLRVDATAREIEVLGADVFEAIAERTAAAAASGA